MKERILDINPEADVCANIVFYTPENAGDFDLSRYDYVVDAVDTVTAKLEIIKRCKASGVPVISSMGTGNKLDPAAFKVADIYSTSVCPLAKVMRKELKALGIKSLKVVYSEELPKKPLCELSDNDAPSRRIPASVSFVPPCAGMIIAGEVIKDIISV